MDVQRFFHRDTLLNPSEERLGYGVSGRFHSPAGVIDARLARWFNYRPGKHVCSPYDQQQNVRASWIGAEIPSPTPEDAARQVNFPIKVNGVQWDFSFKKMRLRLLRGDHEVNCYCLESMRVCLVVSKRPLDYNTRYTTVFEYTDWQECAHVERIRFCTRRNPNGC